MKVLHIIPSFHPAYVYGGAIEVAYRLCRQVARQGHEVRVLTTNANGPNDVLSVATDRTVTIDGFQVRYARRVGGNSVAPRLVWLLPSEVRWADIVHLSAVYSFPVIPTLAVCRILDRPVVWSPLGAFQRWEGTRRRQIKKGWEKVCWSVRPRGLVIHFTSKAEADESQRRCPPVDSVVVPHGVDIPATAHHVCGSDVIRLLFLGRLDPKKGVENLLAACAILNQAPEFQWSLIIAGGGDQRYVASLGTRIRESGLSERITMLGTVAGGEKTALFEAADIVVVPSHTENFGMVVVEALAHGVPVIASRGTPWQRLEEVGCGRWTANDPEELAVTIRRMATQPLREMGDRGRRWMEGEFSWHARAAEMVHVYEALGGSSGSFRRVSAREDGTGRL